MELDIFFILNSMLFGVGLAMDAFSVSLANGLAEPKMKWVRMSLIAGTFAFFQIIMPLAGWVCIHTIASIFTAYQGCIPWIALILLLCIGGKMLIEGIKNKECENEAATVGFWGLMLQGVATSIDALSVGFTIAEYSFPSALLESLIIGIVTFVVCTGGLSIGKKFGTRLAGKATVLGGTILLLIGLEIFIKGVFFL